MPPPVPVPPSTYARFRHVCEQVPIEPPQLLPYDDIVTWNTLDNNPLAPAYAHGPLLANLQISTFSQYTGFLDSVVQIRRFTTSIVMHDADDFLLCRFFPMTLAGHAQT